MGIDSIGKAILKAKGLTAVRIKKLTTIAQILLSAFVDRLPRMRAGADKPAEYIPSTSQSRSFIRSTTPRLDTTGDMLSSGLSALLTALLALVACPALIGADSTELELYGDIVTPGEFESLSLTRERRQHLCQREVP